MQTVAVLGLGVMGSGMARNLIKSGFSVRVHNRTAEKAQPLVAAGAQAASTPAEAAQGADIILSMVGDDEASRAMWLGANGALAAAKPGATLIESSTLSLGWVRELHQAAQARGLQFVDAPVAGSKQAAENGALTLFIGAQSEAVVDALQPVFAAVSQTQVYFGPVGSGATYKLINNMVAATHIAALGEGLALAQSAGLDPAVVTQTLASGAVASPVVKNKLPFAAARQYGDVHFALRWMRKDLTYALQLANELDQPLPVIAGVHEVYQMGMRAGLADQDFAAVTEVARKAGAQGRGVRD